ncbi:hypothetical protein BDV25DRAFT_172050 [Aspergillus avenaceus]|uniref:LysM domain-containing protein n=1 Tax=Aspergillus avenaceus TaxID=36643 RepID=A0A5N6TW95_ASPAV|nr:hypothetical protein BDV25DRAFT_172050 [Aspergillus avenaceus]
MRGLWAALPALLFHSVRGQQPAGIQTFVDYPGLGDECKAALATNVTCPPFLAIVSQDNAILGEDEVGELCVDDCHSSLKSAREAIQAACTESTDVIVYNDVAYPAGSYCDPLFRSWANNSALPNATAACSDCWLGVLEAQLNHPLGYDEDMEENFSSLTSSCSATGYSVTSPTAYALNATATASSVVATATSTSSCDEVYKVEASDDCNSVAKSLSVSTYNLLQTNQLDLYCQTFAGQVGQTLCVPPKCTTHTWTARDTCNSVVGSLANVTLPQFLAWNPNFNSLCLNSPFFIGYEVCISPPGGYLSNGSGDDSGPTATATSTGVATIPTNAVDGSTRNCSQWYTVVKGDECGRVSMAHSISLADFYFLNPEIDEDCSNLQLGEAYCVKPVGSITSYPNYTVTGVLPITVTPANFSSVNTAIPTTTNDPGYEYVGPTLNPTAPGTIPDCYLYENPSYYTTLCRDLGRDNDVTVEDLSEWNPSLTNNAANCTVSSSYSYCVQKYENSTSSSYGVTVAELLAWNTWLSGDCDTALVANLNTTSTRAVCIGVGSKSATTIPASTGSGTATRTTASMGPIQTGVVSGCQRFHTVVDGDDCPSIESKYGISQAQFYQWNPSIGSTCGNLWLGYAYCVKGPSSTTTSASADWNPAIGSNCETLVIGDSVCVGVSS